MSQGWPPQGPAGPQWGPPPQGPAGPQWGPPPQWGPGPTGPGQPPLGPGQPGMPGGQPPRRSRTGLVIGIAAGALALLLVLVLSAVALLGRQRYGTTSPTATPTKPTTASAGAPPRANAEGSGIRVRPQDKPGAPVVAVYSDYQCPACQTFEQRFGDTLLQLADTGEIQLEYRTMTFLDKTLGNSSSSRAALGAACADEVGKYAEYHSAVLRSNITEGQGFTDDMLKSRFAEQAGIHHRTGPSSMELNGAFVKCWESKKYATFVSQVDRAATTSGVTATPTVTVNGKTLDVKSIDDPAQLKAGIDRLK